MKKGEAESLPKVKPLASEIRGPVSGTQRRA